VEEVMSTCLVVVVVWIFKAAVWVQVWIATSGTYSEVGSSKTARTVAQDKALHQL
jgi:hypothetical protein